MESKEKPIYAITCFTRLEEVNTWPDFGSMAFMGFYHDYDDATEAVINNCCDINETCYTYAAVEEIFPGLYAYPKERWLYEYDRESDTYKPIKEPDFLKHIANIL